MSDSDIAINASQKIFDPDFRKKLLGEPGHYLPELLGDFYDDSVDYSVKASTKDTFYIVIPFQNGEIDLSVESISAAGTTGSVSSIGTVGSLGSVCLSFSTASSAGSMATVGSSGD